MLLDRMFKRFMTDEQVEDRYARAGDNFGFAASVADWDGEFSFNWLLSRWEKWEAEYAKRGFRTLPVDDFTYFGDNKIVEGLGIKREEGEDPVFHAVYFREFCLR
jgi:hypothetical protein